jgi:hypothetical protein
MIMHSMAAANSGCPHKLNITLMAPVLSAQCAVSNPRSTSSWLKPNLLRGEEVRGVLRIHAVLATGWREAEAADGGSVCRAWLARLDHRISLYS